MGIIVYPVLVMFNVLDVLINVLLNKLSEISGNEELI